ncbi:MAG: HEAT repeat domain-containing protein [Planctomycetes bacterium]|nr:HEAT repeat domain-containing protein [Planctomycetota bacterium]
MIGWKKTSLAALALAVGLLNVQPSEACLYCNAVSLTFCEEIRASDVSIIARLIERPAPQEAISADAKETDEIVKAKFEVLEVLSGGKHLKGRKQIEVTYFGRAKVGSKFLLMGIDPPTVFWSTPIAVTDRAVGYLRGALKLPKDGPQRLTFFLDHLEDQDEMLARDAYDEFAKAPYDTVKKLKAKMDHGKLIGWIKDVEVPASRRRLYLTMLGVCGGEADLPMLEKIITSGDRKAKSGFDALIGCYLTLKGAKGLKLIEDRFLRSDTIEVINPKTGKTERRKVDYSDTYAAIQALRIQGQLGDALSRDRIVASMRLILGRTKLADLVIPDLARWGDWKSMPTMVKLFKEANPETTWVRSPVLLYLMACPLPEAQKHLAELAKIDPDAYERANAFAPLKPKTK